MARPRGPVDPNASPAARELALKLRALQDARGVTLRELAHRMHYSTSTLSDALNARTVPGAVMLRILLAKLDVPPRQRDELMDLRFKAAEERHAATALPQPTVTDMQQLVEMLQHLRQRSGLSFRSLEAITNHVGRRVSKTTIARTLENPRRDPELARVLATVMIGELKTAKDREWADTAVNRLLKALVVHSTDQLAEPPEAAADRPPSGIEDLPEEVSAQLEKLRQKAAETGRSLDGFTDTELLVLSVQATMTLTGLQAADSKADLRLPDGSLIEVKTTSRKKEVTRAAGYRGEEIMRFLSERGDPAYIHEIAEFLGTSTNAAYSFAHRLGREGLVERVASNKFRLTEKGRVALHSKLQTELVTSESAQPVSTRGAEHNELVSDLNISFWCDNGHEMQMQFNKDAQIPETLDCLLCGSPAFRRFGPPAVRVSPGSGPS